ncbi:MAG TPA: hypothetical protein VMW06_03400 [Desulfobacterales bacterium]|nr:hypothetical protein [Desulfobacterales bacterium]
MNCMFCESEINENDIIQEGLDARIAGQKTCPLEYNCPQCIHVWVTEVCVGRFSLDPFFEDSERRMALSRCIRKLCEQSDDNRLQEPLSLQKLSYLWMKK